MRANGKNTNPITSFETILLLIALGVIYPTVLQFQSIEISYTTLKIRFLWTLAFLIQTLSISFLIFNSTRLRSKDKIMSKAFLYTIPMIVLFSLTVLFIDWTVGLAGTFIILSYWSGVRTGELNYSTDSKENIAPIIRKLLVVLGLGVLITSIIHLIFAYLGNYVINSQSWISYDQFEVVQEVFSVLNPSFIAFLVFIYLLFNFIMLLAWIEPRVVHKSNQHNMSRIFYRILFKSRKVIFFIALFFLGTYFLIAITLPISHYYIRPSIKILGSLLQIISWTIGYFNIKSLIEPKS